MSDAAGPSGANEELVRDGDLDQLVRHIDRLSDAGDWETLVDLQGRCRRAFDTGRQLWPAASLAQYRLALLAPAAQAAAALGAGEARFAPGPLTEVVASTHAWAELAPHLPWGPEATLCAHERAVRGDPDTAAAAPGPVLFELPLALQPWEPAYPAATYRSNRVEAPAPELPGPRALRLPGTAHRIEDPVVVDALRGLAAAWVRASSGRSAAAAVRGTAAHALTALGCTRARATEIDAGTALALMSWAAASGGAHGRRRGAAAGRADAWWALAALAGLDRDWPVPPDELGLAAGELRWYLWDEAEAHTGWVLRLAVEDPAEDLAWAVVATDQT